MRFVILQKAQNQIDALPRSDYARIMKKLRVLTELNDTLASATHLTGFNVYRFRVGDYRIIGEVQDDTFYVLLVRRRDKAYRDL